MAGKKANVTPNVLRWAREDADLSLDVAAKRAGINDTKNQPGADRLDEWENGLGSPTWRQLENLAKTYHRPVLTFFMSAPPQKERRGEDFRTVGGRSVDLKSPTVEALLRRLYARHDEIIELLAEEEGAHPVPFIGAATLGTPVDELVESIREALDINLQAQFGMRNTESLFRYLRSTAERAGVFVFLEGNLGSHHSDIDADVFRGFALADRLAPFVVVNKNDAKAAHSFTLMHELCHLWLGESGISNISPFGAKEDGQVERYCNKVASEFLLPEKMLLEEWREQYGPDVPDAISCIADVFSVSRTAVAHKLWSISEIDDDDWWHLYSSYQAEWREFKERQRERDRAEESSGPGYYINTAYRLGKPILRTVLRAVDNGLMTYTRASRVLNVNPANFDGLRAHVF